MPDFPDGAWLVELADTHDPELIARRVAATFGVREEPDRPLAATLAEVLRGRRLLLILDTCEHLVEGSAELVHQLLAGCPFAAGDRDQPGAAAGPGRDRVAGPAAGGAGPRGPAVPGRPAGYEAIRLFADRAAAARAGFALGRDNAEAVARLCRTLDGMPLAIELAAARVRALSVEQIASRLDDRFRLLASGDRTAPPRQQTLRAAVDWSYELLSEPEQILLRRLSVFAGWSLEMAEQVCADEQIPAAAVLDLMAALIDKSLVTFDYEFRGQSRYRMLDTIKEYAASRLAASGEEDAVRLRHRDYLLRLGEYVVAQAFVRGAPSWPERVAHVPAHHPGHAELPAGAGHLAGAWRHRRGTAAVRGDAQPVGDAWRRHRGSRVVRPVPGPGVRGATGGARARPGVPWRPRVRAAGLRDAWPAVPGTAWPRAGRRA